MNYEKIYNDLILNRQQNPVTSGYKENHHIIPSSLGGSDDKHNRVNLTAREHYMAHLLLARFQRCSQNSFALHNMQRKNSNDPDKPFIKSARLYEWIRIECAKYTSEIMKIANKGDRNPNFGNHFISNIELKENICVNRLIPIPVGWVKGRNKWKEFELQYICDNCSKLFANKYPRRFCSRKCECLAKPNIVKDNFEALKIEYDKHGVLSKAFSTIGISFNGPIFKKFFELYNNAGVA